MVRRERASVTSGVAVVASLGLAVALACGPKPEPTVTPVTAPSASASASAAPTAPPKPPPSGMGSLPLPTAVPAAAPMPPPGVVGSKKIRRRDDAQLRACVPAKIASKDVAGELAKVAAACERAAKLKPVGAALRGSQKDDAPAAEHKVKVEAGKCYRVYVAHDGASLVVGMRDSAGDLVGESPTLALPEAGLVCFTASDEVAITVASGSGRADYAVQLFAE
ncbi:MAG: hypothetical protein JNL38_05665 [Myxococcales bacterium]|nr:hypothetical protein [Myxococcales bacterium]